MSDNSFDNFREIYNKYAHLLAENKALRDDACRMLEYQEGLEARNYSYVNRIEELEAQNAKLKSSLELADNSLKEVGDYVVKLEEEALKDMAMVEYFAAQNAKMREALEFYADENNWSEKRCYDEDGCLFNIVMDISDVGTDTAGETAKQVLKEIDESTI